MVELPAKNKNLKQCAMLLKLSDQITWFFLLALPTACIAWTVAHEEVFKEPGDFCIQKSKSGKSLLHRKFFYLFTCKYRFSHYVVVTMLFITQYHLLFTDWR